VADTTVTESPTRGSGAIDAGAVTGHESIAAIAAAAYGVVGLDTHAKPDHLTGLACLVAEDFFARPQLYINFEDGDTPARVARLHTRLGYEEYYPSAPQRRVVHAPAFGAGGPGGDTGDFARLRDGLPAAASTYTAERSYQMRRLWRPILMWILAVIAALTVVPAAAARADAVAQLSGSERNFVALLRPGGPAHAFGVVIFRQPQDAEKVVLVDVWTLGLAPNHSYSLQRATDSTVDDECQGTNWLTLGRGLEPQAIETNDWGFGRAHLFRDLATVPDGTQFDIQFRVIDSVTQDVVLVSSCHQFRVSP
jgi:hypothetical protein